MGKHLTRVLIATVVFGGLSAPIVVQAQSVMVLGLRSAEGDDEFVNNVTGALRNAASRVSGWELNTREVSLAQMTLAHGCEAADVSCMEAIGNTLGVTYLIYGNVRRTSTSANHDYALNLFVFDTDSGSIRDQLTDTIPRVQSDIDDLRPRVRRYIARFSGAEQTGTIQVQVNLPAAEIVVDGEPTGTTTGGSFQASVAVGQHVVEVRADGHNTFRGTITVVPNEVARLEVELNEGDEDEIVVVSPDGQMETLEEGDGGGLNWGAITSFGIAGVGAVMTIISWVMVDSANNDLRPIRRTVGRVLAGPPMLVPPEQIETTDSCAYMRDDAGSSRWNDGIGICDKGELWQTLQYVFIGITGAAALAGILFLVLDSDDEESPNTLSIIPSFGPERSSVTARMTF